MEALRPQGRRGAARPGTRQMSRWGPAPALPVDRDVAALIVKVGDYPLHHGGVDAIRSLGRLGVPVYAVSEDRWTPAALSRYCRGRYVWPPRGARRSEANGRAAHGSRAGDPRTGRAHPDRRRGGRPDRGELRRPDRMVPAAPGAAQPAGPAGQQARPVRAVRRARRARARVLVPADGGRRRGVRRRRDVPCGGQEPGGVGPAARAGGQRDHGDRHVGGAARAGPRVGGQAERHPAGIHPSGARRGLDRAPVPRAPAAIRWCCSRGSRCGRGRRRRA